jgi:streptogramin lyase
MPIVRFAAVAAVVILGVVLGIQLVDVGGGIGQPPPSSEEPQVSGEPGGEALTDHVVGRYELGLEHGHASLVAFESVWVADEAGNVLRTDPSSGAVTAHISVDGVGCGPLTSTAQSIWFASCGASPSASPDTVTTIRIDPGTNSVAQVFDDGSPDGIGASSIGGGVWFITDIDRGVLVKVNESTGEEMARLELGLRVRFLTAGFGSLWVSPIGADLGHVLRIDPETGDTLATVALSGDAGFLTTGADGIWVAEPFQWLLARVDPTTDRVAGEWLAPVGASQIVLDGEGRVWVVGNTEAVGIDATAGQEVERFGVPTHTQFEGIATYPLSSGRGSLWWAEDADLLRLEPVVN